MVYAADSDAVEHKRCRALLDEWRAQASPWYLTWSIVYEFCRVTTHPRVFRKPWTAKQSWSFVHALLASPAVEVLTETQRHDAVLADLISSLPAISGNIFHDAHTVAVMREHGIRIVYTRDTDFHRFPNIEVRDPLR